MRVWKGGRVSEGSDAFNKSLRQSLTD